MLVCAAEALAAVMARAEAMSAALFRIRFIGRLLSDRESAVTCWTSSRRARDARKDPERQIRVWEAWRTPLGLRDMKLSAASPLQRQRARAGAQHSPAASRWMPEATLRPIS